MPGAVRTSIGARGIPREETRDGTSWGDGREAARQAVRLKRRARAPRTSNLDGAYKLGYLLLFRVM